MTGKTCATAIFLLLSIGLCRLAHAQDKTPHLPDAQLTPGDAGDDATDVICKREYVNPTRRIPIKLKDRVFARYGIGKYEVGYNIDHLIPPKLGGANSIKNLWPQPLAGVWGWHGKNRLSVACASWFAAGG